MAAGSQGVDEWRAEDWLVHSRAKAHGLLLELWKFSKTKSSLSSRHPERSIFGLFAGAAFSLWRAAFYIPPDKNWEKTLLRINNMLERVVRNNAFTYESEKAFEDWTGGFYLNNARYRLKRLQEKMAERSKQFGAILASEEFKKFGGITTPGAIDESDHMGNWDSLYNALTLLFRAFRDTYDEVNH